MLGKNSTLNNSFDIVKNPRSRKLRVPAFTMPAMSDAASSPNDPVFPSDSADDEPARGPRGIQSVEVGGQLLKALARTGRRMALKDLAREAGMTAAKAHPYLVSFCKLGLMEQDRASGHYGLGPLAIQMGLISLDRKSTRLNSSHLVISYAVFCLKKKNQNTSSLQSLLGVMRHHNSYLLFPCSRHSPPATIRYTVAPSPISIPLTYKLLYTHILRK